MAKINDKKPRVHLFTTDSGEKKVLFSIKGDDVIIRQAEFDALISEYQKLK